MRPPYNPGKADRDIDISASRLHIKLKFSWMVKETCIFNSIVKVIQAVKSSHSQKKKTFHQGGPHASTYSTPFFGNPWTMEGIKNHYHSPWIYSQSCIPILVLSEPPGSLYHNYNCFLHQ